MVLRIPDVRQQADFDCGPAAIDSVLLFLGLPRYGPATLANPVDGMPPATVESVLRSVGLKVLSGQMTLADLKHITSSGRPVVCPVALHSGHWVVVAGVERMRVYFQCPVDGPRAVPAKEWSALWSDRSRTHEYAAWGIAVSQ